MLREEATLEELAFVGDSWSVNIDKLVRLINSKQIEVTDDFFFGCHFKPLYFEKNRRAMSLV